MGQRLKETVLARAHLAKLIKELDLYPALRPEDAIEQVRGAVGFRVSDAETYVISFRARSPELAQKVTQRLTDALIDENMRLRAEQADVAAGFLDAERKRNEEALRVKEIEMARFVASHPEFAGEQTATVGAAMRAAKRAPVEPEGSTDDPGLLALRREEQRLRQQIVAPTQPAARSDPTLAAAAKDAEARLAAAQRDLAERRTRFTEEHPDVHAAVTAVRRAEEALRAANEALSKAAPPAKAPELGPDAKAALQARLAEVQQEIRDQAKKKKAAGANEHATLKESTEAQQIVALETEWRRIDRELREARERYEALDIKQFAANITASSLATGRVARIVVIDPAFLPAKPVGMSNHRLLLMGLAASLVLGLGMAVLVAVFDDRVYDHKDIDTLGVAPVLIEVPEVRRSRAWRVGRG
jgi:uncharacterized protein involved in exopolysaccharide biosynthesis